MSRCSSTGSDRKEHCTSTQDGLKLIELLQNFLVQQTEHIEVLKTRIRNAEEERDAYKHKLEASSSAELLWSDKATQTGENSASAVSTASNIST